MRVYASDQPLTHVALECPDNEDLDRVFDAIDALAGGWLLPLGVGFRLEQIHPETFEELPLSPPRNVLVRGPSFAGVVAREAFSDSLVEEHSPTRASVVDAIQRHVKECPFNTQLGELVWTAVRARGSAEPMSLLLYGSRVIDPVSYMVEGRRWYAGPTDVDGSRPALLRASLARIHVALYWDLWKRDLSDGVVRATALGWTLEE